MGAVDVELNGFITSSDENLADKEQLIFKKQITNIKAPHFVMFVREYLEKKYGENALTEILKQQKAGA